MRVRVRGSDGAKVRIIEGLDYRRVTVKVAGCEGYRVRVITGSL